LPGFHDTHINALEAGNEVGGACQLPADLPPDHKDMAKAIKEGIRKQKG